MHASDNETSDSPNFLLHRKSLYLNEKTKLLNNGTCTSKEFMQFDLEFKIINWIWICSSLACTDSKHSDKIFDKYSQPIDLGEFFNCTQNLTVQSDDATKLKLCGVDHMRQLLSNFSQRFDADDKWCVAALGLSEEVIEM